MFNKNLLTLCIPTYNRKQIVSELIDGLLRSGVNNIADILIIDDGSKDRTYQALMQFCSYKNIQVLANESNIGYARTFMRCFDECKTEYLIMCTDDDAFSKDGVLQILEEINSHKPDFISTTFNTSESTRKFNRISEISFLDIWDAAKHAPGLVYKTSALSSSKEAMNELLSKNSIAAFFFPQVILLTLMKCMNLKLITSPTVIARKHPNGSQETQLVDQSGNVYLSLSNVVDRHKSFSRFYQSLIEDSSFKEHLPALKRLLALHKSSLFSNIEAGIALEDPILIKEFRRGGIKKLLNIKSMLRKLFRGG
jgi:glycosyltransferase involved in cell wall biosynthesis